EARGRRQQIYEAVEAAAAFYHEVLMNDPAASRARGYLRSRGYDGEVVRTFRLGFAPASFDALVRALKFPERTMADAGLVGRSDKGRIYDVFRERIIFPIFDPGGRAVALGGRVLPEELRTMTGTPGPKYRNSAESAVYRKRATLYGLNWAKTEITSTKEAVICEGYTDVIGFFRAGVPRAVATCGTSLTEDHVRLLSRFAPRVVLCFDQDKAGQNAAARLYEWEKRHEIELAVAALPDGTDPADLARTDPDALKLAVSGARPFLGFRVERALAGEDLAVPEGRTRAAERAIAAIAEHPNPLVRDQYLLAVADQTRHNPEQLRGLLAHAVANPPPEERTAIADRASNDRQGADRAPSDEPPPRDEPEFDDGPNPDGSVGDEIRAGRDALRLAIGRPEAVVTWIDECLFVAPDQREAFRALASASELHEAIEKASPVAANLIRRLAAFGSTEDLDPDGIFLELVRNAATRAIADAQADARRAALSNDLEATAAIGGRSRWLKEELELLRDPVDGRDGASPAVDAAHRLLAWLSEAHREG
ncbi:MAG TPA: toprim domain-containing protein, partial [Acidimicrobiales bacterium]|nr:toprim domain-containing protein [Acidimicrobiales bacterium]